MKRRVTIARSLINEPELLLLDEPTTGLDPQARHVLWDRLYRLKQQGVTLVLTTHYMDEAEQLCDRLVVMDHGRIVAEGSPRQLIEQHSTREVLELRFAAGTNEASAPIVAGIGERHEVLPDRILVYADDGEQALTEVHDRGARAGERARAAQQPGGRLPAPHRPHAGGLRRWQRPRPPIRVLGVATSPSTSGIWRSNLAQRRSCSRCCTCSAWASASARSSTANSSSTEVLGGVTYVAFLAPGAAGDDGDDGRRRPESMWPVLDGFMWRTVLHGDDRDADRGRRHRRSATCLARLPPASSPAPRSRRRCRSCRRPGRWGSCSPSRSPCCTGLAFGMPIDRLVGDASRPTPPSPPIQRFVIIPMFLFAGAFYPISQLPGWLQLGRLRHARCGTASSCAAAPRSHDARRRRAALVHVAVPDRLGRRRHVRRACRSSAGGCST